ncbi:hypothetical protein D6C92_02976 [Aureobasidium pullulans]|nr:hypothetical protein D6C92_02976 [Aureobasidium pullulans]
MSSHPRLVPPGSVERGCVHPPVSSRKLSMAVFLEATTSEVFINDTSVEHFGLFADWIMKGCIAINHTLRDLIQLYIMADQFDVKELRTRITDALAYVCYEIDFSLPEREAIPLVVDDIPESMPLYRLLAKAVARLLFLLLSTSHVALLTTYLHCVLKISPVPHSSSVLSSIFSPLSTFSELVFDITLVLNLPFPIFYISSSELVFDNTFVLFLTSPSFHFHYPIILPSTLCFMPITLYEKIRQSLLSLISFPLPDPPSLAPLQDPYAI